MSLNPSTLSGFADASPCAKLTVNINAFNGNTTHFNRRPHPKSSLLLTTISPVQPRGDSPSFLPNVRVRPIGSIMPM
jgi:hypothetical protein